METEPVGDITAPTIRALTITEVAERVEYTPRVIRALVKAGTFPEPIDRRIPPRSWRWASPIIDLYCSGEWEAA